MSSYPITGCGRPSKPRAAQPSMFQILSWAGENQMSESRFQEPHQQFTYQTCSHAMQSNASPTKNLGIQQELPVYYQNDAVQTQNSKNYQKQQVYKEHKNTSNLLQTKPQPQNKVTIITQKHSQPKEFKQSHLKKKQIKHELYSYDPVNLKASRSKSAAIVIKPQFQEKIHTKKQEVQLDQKTIKERKHKIKDFEIFTRVLPNSAFTTYYGKPAFQAYGRGTSCQNFKSFNVMPHKGDNHPKNIESHYTALIKARNVKSKSYMPRKPIQQVLPSHSNQQEYLETKIPQLPLQKPDLVKSTRFATIVPETGKKAGPPITKKRKIHSAKKNVSNVPQSRQAKSKSFKQPLGDGLKYMNKRQNLIYILEEKKLKASQLAYKVTECYPLEVQALNLEKQTAKQNLNCHNPAGKSSNRGDPVSDLIQSCYVLKQNNVRVK